MKHEFFVNIKDIFSIFFLRIKLIMNDAITFFVLTSSVLLFSFIIHYLTISVEVQSAIPIGIIDYDQTQSSKELIDHMKEIPTIKVIEKNEEVLQKLLIDEMINAYFVIDDGYEKKIITGRLNKLLTMHFLKDNQSASIISDIVAGEMMLTICFYKSYQYYDRIQFHGEKHSLLEYRSYIQNLIETSSDFDFSFQINYENPSKTIVNQKPITNALLYKQLIIGILGVLTALIAMFIVSGVVRDKELGIKERLSITRYHRLKQDAGIYLVIFFIESIISAIFCLLILSRLNTIDYKQWGSMYLLILMNAMVMGGIFILISKFMKSMIVYQIICSILLLVTSGLGFYYLVSGIYQTWSDKFIKIIPNSWLIQGFTDIIVYEKEGGYIKSAHQVLLFMTIVCMLLIIVIEFISKKIESNYN